MSSAASWRPLRWWQQVGHLVLLREGQRLGRGACARVVIARECEHDDEAEKDGEAGRQDAEHARGAVAVVEVAAHRRAPAHEQHAADGDGSRRDDDGQRDGDVHRRAPRRLTIRATILRAHRAVITRIG